MNSCVHRLTSYNPVISSLKSWRKLSKSKRSSTETVMCCQRSPNQTKIYRLVSARAKRKHLRSLGVSRLERRRVNSLHCRKIYDCHHRHFQHKFLTQAQKQGRTSPISDSKQREKRSNLSHITNTILPYHHHILPSIYTI